MPNEKYPPDIDDLVKTIEDQESEEDELTEVPEETLEEYLERVKEK
ncbi:MAG: hypothetical protein ABI067_15800 [Leifsonia sp.]